MLSDYEIAVSAPQMESHWQDCNLFADEFGSPPTDWRDVAAIDGLAGDIAGKGTPSRSSALQIAVSQFLYRDLAHGVDFSDMDRLAHDPDPRPWHAAEVFDRTKVSQSPMLNLSVFYADPALNRDPADAARLVYNPDTLRVRPDLGLPKSLLGLLPKVADGTALDVSAGATTDCAIAKAGYDLRIGLVAMHNKLVDMAKDQPRVPANAAAQFRWARHHMVALVHRLILTAYLPAVCNRDVLAEVKRIAADPSGGRHMAQLCYADNGLFQQSTSTSCLTIAYLFGAGLFADAMVGWTAPAQEAFDPTAPDETPNGLRFRSGALARAFRDPSDSALVNPVHRAFRRGYIANLATAQDVLAALHSDDLVIPRRLTPDELCRGPQAEFLRERGFGHSTPLLYYILCEAELSCSQSTLGRLGSHIVGQTLYGAVARSRVVESVDLAKEGVAVDRFADIVALGQAA